MEIPCWIGGEAEMACLVQARETIQIPPVKHRNIFFWSLGIYNSWCKGNLTGFE
jgi:hypothetical protein